jgi:hypothetical protein
LQVGAIDGTLQIWVSGNYPARMWIIRECVSRESVKTERSWVFALTPHFSRRTGFVCAGRSRLKYFALFNSGFRVARAISHSLLASYDFSRLSSNIDGLLSVVARIQTFPPVVSHQKESGSVTMDFVRNPSWVANPYSKWKRK